MYQSKLRIGVPIINREQSVLDSSHPPNGEYVTKSTYLARFLAEKSREEISEISATNPELIEEWLDELKQTKDEADFVKATTSQAIEYVLRAARPASKIAAE